MNGQWCFVHGREEKNIKRRKMRWKKANSRKITRKNLKEREAVNQETRYEKARTRRRRRRQQGGNEEEEDEVEEKEKEEEERPGAR